MNERNVHLTEHERTEVYLMNQMMFFSFAFFFYILSAIDGWAKVISHFIMAQTLSLSDLTLLAN